ncbi:probable ATP-dependent DNA helicase HFM1 [Schistocerca cancellata]|uniref:probable ATP-dependent DNA helicase HFM1 n=1 Tax=Schistocerca cancellata TaxID=274614 RepID=UPI002118AD94|nr:probable ATP-dependent DNA helicase HFM1 [Schistocerca cancellata]
MNELFDKNDMEKSLFVPGIQIGHEAEETGNISSSCASSPMSAETLGELSPRYWATDNEFPHTIRESEQRIYLRTVQEIPEQYQQIFSSYPSFNVMQSKLLEDVLYTDRSIVVAAPTGSGKTVIFELGIIWLLMKIKEQTLDANFKIVYMAPIKALCRERVQDWTSKFSYLGLKCQEVTGDSDATDLYHLLDYHILFTTPEKWDSLTRKWRDNHMLVEVVKLFLIDEVHVLSEERRGPIIEAVISRMKIIEETLNYKKPEISHKRLPFPVRFIAVSATLPNIEDIATWLGKFENPAKYFKISEEHRPVKLNKIVLGYNCPQNMSQFRFDISLSYKLKPLLLQYSDGKPTLIFCSTRKGVIQTTDTLCQQLTFHFNISQREHITKAISNIRENKLKECVNCGVGFHHAGMDLNDRYVIETLFRSGYLPVLVATSTLALGVNLPAHLVIVKSTQHYMGGVYANYSDSQVLQMIGRAGRPQYDTEATAIVMTKENEKEKYEKLIEGKDLIESNLHRHLKEHINSEVVLRTITETAVAMNWMRSTFLYVRAIRNPQYYGIPTHFTKKGIENKLQEMCLRELNALATNHLVKMDVFDVQPTETGRLMARYYIAFETMKIFSTMTGEENLSQMLQHVTSCSEFSVFQLRTSDKKCLNSLNKVGLRYPLKGRIKTKEMKVNCLIQAAFGCLTVEDPSLHQEMMHIIRIGQRVTKCLVHCMLLKSCYRGVLNSIVLAKCFHCRLWENSPYVSRQLDRIGPVLSELLVVTGKKSFKDIADSNPRDLERILNRPPPMGNKLQESAMHLPEYQIKIKSTVFNYTYYIEIELLICNSEAIRTENTAGPNHGPCVIIGDSNNKLHIFRRLKDVHIIDSEQRWALKIEEKVKDVFVHVISEYWVGIDVRTTIQLLKISETPSAEPDLTVNKERNSDYKCTKNISETVQENMAQESKKRRPSFLDFKAATDHFLQTTGGKRFRLENYKPNCSLELFLHTPLKEKQLFPTNSKKEPEKTIQIYETDKPCCRPIKLSQTISNQSFLQLQKQFRKPALNYSKKARMVHEILFNNNTHLHASDQGQQYSIDSCSSTAQQEPMIVKINPKKYGNQLINSDMSEGSSVSQAGCKEDSSSVSVATSNIKMLNCFYRGNGSTDDTPNKIAEKIFQLPEREHSHCIIHQNQINTHEKLLQEKVTAAAPKDDAKEITALNAVYNQSLKIKNNNCNSSKYCSSVDSSLQISFDLGIEQILDSNFEILMAETIANKEN